MPSVSFFDLSALSAERRAALLHRSEADLDVFVDKVRPIVGAVREGGDAALVRFAEELDGADLDPSAILATREEFERAGDGLDAGVKGAIHFAIDNIRRFHEAQKPEAMWFTEVRPGVMAGDRITPIPSVGCYVPRGKGAFPSVAMMTMVPAVVAGVPKIVVFTPPTQGGTADAATLYVAGLLGIERVVKAGGAVAVAAAAYGTKSIPKLAKIVGPGSPWYVAAKRLVADAIDTGTPAGPSEAIVFADASADPRLAAADLMIEAEHGPDSSAFLVTADRALAETVADRLPRLWAALGETRRGYVEAVLCGPRGGVVLAPDVEAACAFINGYAPEHLEVLSAEPFAHLPRLKHAGEILLGARTPITLGNFVIGPNCVLPTGGQARTHGPLSVFDFMKRTSIAHVTSDAAYRDLADPARRLAVYEGFEAHAAALRPDRLDRS